MMSASSDNKELIAEARGWANSREGWSQYQHDLGHRLAGALEQVTAERDEAEAVRELDQSEEGACLCGHVRSFHDANLGCSGSHSDSVPCMNWRQEETP